MRPFRPTRVHTPKFANSDALELLYSALDTGPQGLFSIEILFDLIESRTRSNGWE